MAGRGQHKGWFPPYRQAGAEQPADAPEDRSPFAFGTFRSIWIANLGSNLGTLIQSVGASWLMVASGASPQMIALVQASASLPIVLLSLASGALADNLDRRKIMLSAQAFLLTVSGCLAALTFFGFVNPWLLLAFTFLVGCGTALNGPAWQASVGDMVPRAVLPNAVTLNAMGMNLARSVGPAVGGAIVAIGGAAAAFLVNALSSIGLIFVLSRWRTERPPPPLPPERLADAMRAGLRFVLMSPHVGIVLVRAALFGCTASAIQALLPLVARDLLGGGPLTFGLLLGSFGLGAVASALSIKHVRRLLSAEAIVRSAILLTTVGAAGTGVSHTAWLTCPFLTLAGAGWLLAMATINVSVQLASPRWVVARALSLYQMAAYGGVAAGSWLIGYCADHIGTQDALYVAAALNLATLAVALMLPLAETGVKNLDLSNRWQVPETALPIEHRSGPIIITIEHRVLAGKAMPFLAAMRERRRIRLRDGARGWTLSRDLADPQLWVERYHVPTWLDYVRHNSRRTLEDDANSETLRALRIDDSEPVVHRRIERQLGSLPSSRAAGPEILEGP